MLIYFFKERRNLRPPNWHTLDAFDLMLWVSLLLQLPVMLLLSLLLSMLLLSLVFYGPSCCMVSAVAVVPSVVYTSSTGVSASSGVLILAGFLNVPVLSCAHGDPVALTAVDVPGILAVATTSAVAAIPILMASRLLLVLPMFLAALP